MKKWSVPAVLALSLAPRIGWSQTPLGADFQLNTYTTASQNHPAVASDEDGQFVVVWEETALRDGYGTSIWGRRYDAMGNPVEGTEFLVNAYTTGSQHRPAVDSDASGRLVVAWHNTSQDGSQYGVTARLYEPSGMAGPEFVVNTWTFGTPSEPDVAWRTDGSFVVVWTSRDQDGAGAGVFGQRYDALGTAQGVEFRLNTFTTSEQRAPTVAATAGGGFVVVWQSHSQDGHQFGVFARRYDSAGAAIGAEFRVNSYTTDSQRFPVVASGPDGSFLVVWQSSFQNGFSAQEDLFAQRYAASGAAVGGEFQINTTTGDGQRDPAMAADGNGNFVVTWTSFDQDGYGNGVFGRHLAAAGPPSAEFRVNLYTTSQQSASSVASDANGNFVVTWTSFDQDGSYLGLFGRRFTARSDVIFSDGFE